MSQPKALPAGAAAAATLPVTGNSTVLLVLTGLVALVVGLLLVRGARGRRAVRG